ncbi:MAG TPA: hypothetical protein VFE51_28255 [Verrucomicrobiae bacterium]|nr:hypothetical protein [Verrucomicrobiae bacterium]
MSVLDSMQHTLVSLLCLFFLGTEAEASETGSPGPRLSGIVSLAEFKRAVLESSSRSGSTAGWSVLAEGQREGQLAVLEIHPDTATVKARLHAKAEPTELTLTNPAAKLPQSSGIVLENAFLDPVLNLYAEFSGRTLLRSPTLPKVYVTVVAAVKDRAGAVQALQAALSEQGIAAIPDGKKFLMIVRAQEAGTVAPRSDQIGSDGSNSESELIPAGALSFPGTDINQVAMIYAELVGRKLDRGTPFPVSANSVIRFRNQTPLTPMEARYALDTVFGWAGLKMVPDGNDLIKPFPVSRKER